MDILKWLRESLQDFNSSGCISTHLNLPKDTNDNYFNTSINVFNKLNKDLEFFDIKLSDLRIELQFELLSEDNIIKGVTTSFLDLIGSLDKNNPPEVIISKRKRDYIDYLPKIEYYMSPLPFIIESLENNYYEYYYTEYRTLDELLKKNEYTRWFNVVKLY